VDALNVSEGSLLVVASPDQNILLAAGNVPCVRVTTGEQLSTYEVLWPDKIVFTEDAFSKLEARLGVKEVA
jgi:ribosomal protein L4